MKRQNYLLFLFSICLSVLLGGCGYAQIGIDHPVLPAPQLNLTPTDPLLPGTDYTLT
jgi:hypothetical protein